MTVTIQWFLENRVIYMETPGKLLLEEVGETSNTIINMIDNSDAPLVHVVINEIDLESFPKSLKAFNDAVSFLRHPRIGWLIIYPSTNQFAKFMSGMVAGIAKVRFRRLETLDESLAFLTSMDSTLPSSEELLMNWEA